MIPLRRKPSEGAEGLRIGDFKLTENKNRRAGKEKLDERQKTCRLQRHVRGAGHPDGGGFAVDGAVL